MTKTRLSLLIAVAVLAGLMLFPSAAFANFAIHGGYVADTDACAGCHRAHTSISSITWTDNYDASTQHSALLVSSATKMYEFCYACHGADAQGADTNVQEGLYEGTLYGTQGAILNGGGFDSLGSSLTSGTSSTHIYEGSPWGAYGGGVFGAADAANNYDPYDGGSATGNWLTGNTGMTEENIYMDCVSCHDPHGSSNYRILKDTVYGNRVGGYFDDGSGTNASINPTPTPWVTSVETGYPDGGFKLHQPGANQVAGYVPNYTTPMYAQGTTASYAIEDPDVSVAGAKKGMSGWCVGCHGTYLTKTSTYNAGDFRVGDDPWVPFTTRHRHPINVALSNFHGQRSLVVTLQPLPLAHNPASEEGSNVANQISDWVECLTCHRAHGTSATMTGWADSKSNQNPEPNTAEGVPPEEGGVVAKGDGNDHTALLRGDNRYVCEVCHNK